MGNPNIRKGEPKRENVEIYEARKAHFELEGLDFTMNQFHITALENPQETTPGLMETGSVDKIMEIYADRPDLVNKVMGKGMAPIPYSMLHSDENGSFGDFSEAAGQDAFADIDLSIDTESLNSPDWAKDLHRFAQLKLARKFSLDEELAGLRGIDRKPDGNLLFNVGMSKYSEAFFSMGSEGVTADVSDALLQILEEQHEYSKEEINELKELSERYSSAVGENGTVRDIILEKLGRLPEFGEQIHHYLLGVAGTVMTKDGHFVFVERGKGVSINRGVNVTSSGAVKFNKDFMEKHGLPIHLGNEMHHETTEELGLKSGSLLLGSMQERIKLELGMDFNEYDLTAVGMARELPRGGSPEAMFLIEYGGSVNDLLAKIASNPHKDKAEIDSFVYAAPVDSVQKLLKQKDADRVIQHKGLLNLMMINNYMENRR
jgi:hypothetical protein